jgi:hypothetical protein
MGSSVVGVESDGVESGRNRAISIILPHVRSHGPQEHLMHVFIQYQVRSKLRVRATSETGSEKSGVSRPAMHRSTLAEHWACN